MKQVIVVAVAAAVALAGPDYEAMFKAFKDKHTKVYASVTEEAKRFEAFTRNMKRAAIQQAANPLATFGANAYADRTEAELTKLHNATATKKAQKDRSTKKVTAVSAEARAKARGTSIDWRTKGAVGPAVNQGPCGGGWAISAAGNIEGVWAAAGNQFVPASAEEIIICSGSNDCGGNEFPEEAFQWLVQYANNTIVTNASFPYMINDPASCPADIGSYPTAAVIKSYDYLPSSEDALAASVLQNGPLTVIIDGTSLVLYTGGIITNCVSQSADLPSLVVGYDDINVPPYWILRNNWGEDWGEEGFFRIAKGSNQCLITVEPTTVFV